MLSRQIFLWGLLSPEILVCLFLSATTGWIHSCYHSFPQHRKRRQLLHLMGTRDFCDTPHSSTPRTTKTPTKETLAAKFLQARLRIYQGFPDLAMTLSHIQLIKKQNNSGSALGLCAQCAHLPQHPCDRTPSRKEGALHNSLCPRALDSSVAHQMGLV